MKINSIRFLAMLTVLFAFSTCKDNDDMPAPVRLIVSGVADTTIVSPASSLSVNTNTAASYSLNRVTAGAISSTGAFTAGTTEGVFTLTIKNQSVSNDSVVKIIVVTQYAQLFNNMRSNGGYLLSFRHANATSGIDQVNSPVPEWWKSCDSTIARQLTPNIGAQQADTTGRVIKLLGMPLDTIMSSVYCRCVKTAEALNLSLPIKQYEELSQHYDEQNRYGKTMALYASKPVNSKNYISVTHAGFARYPTPSPLQSLEWGDCAVFKLNGVGVAPTYQLTIKLADWLNLGRR